MPNWRSNNRDNRSKSSYWEKNNYKGKRKHQYVLVPGLSGFLCTCVGKFREKECVRDSYNILNEFGDGLFGSERPPVKDLPPPDDNKAGNVVDIDASLEEELASLKSERKTPIKERRFQVVESGANGIVFIKSTVPDPVKLVHHIVSSIAESKVQKSKFLLRLLPVEVVCCANMNDIKAAADKLFDKYFSEGKKTFSIVFSHRNNDRLSRQGVIDTLAELVCAKNPTNKADLTTPQLAVLVEVIRTVCCLSVMPDYYKLKKYNILELSNVSEKATVTGEVEDNQTPESETQSELTIEQQPDDDNTESVCKE